MTPQELKNSILQLAIQGKLVEQRPEEGVAEVPAAPKHGGKEARRHREIEPPFDIPESWRWVRLPQLAEITYGFPFDSQQFNSTGEGMPLIRIRDVLPAKTKTFTKESCPSRYLIRDGDMLVGMDGNFNIGFWKGGDALLNQRVCKIAASSDAVLQKFLYYYLPFALEKIEKNASFVTVKHLSAKDLTNTLVPLPPLAEQKRIVSRIEELLPLLARYEQAWTKLEAFNTRFPSDLQKSLLQLAIQGKLVPQLPEEGIAQVPAAPNTEKKKARRHGEEIEPPFDIPESWRWVRLGEVADVQLGKMLDKGKNKGTPHPYLANLSVRWRSFDLSALRTMRFTEPECEKFALLPGDVLMCEGGVPGRCAVWRQEHSPIKYQKAVHRIRSAVLFPDFIQLYFEAIVDNTWFAEQFTGTTIKHLPRERLIQTPIPLPPLAEQKRIVAKLEELLPLCEKLK